MVQNYLLAVGINCELTLADTALYMATRLDGTKYDMVINTIAAPTCRMPGLSAMTRPPTRPVTLPAATTMTWPSCCTPPGRPDGWTQENIDKVHEYLRDSAIAYGMVNPQNMTIWRNDLDLQNEVKEIAGYIAPAHPPLGNI